VRISMTRGIAVPLTCFGGYPRGGGQIGQLMNPLGAYAASGSSTKGLAGSCLAVLRLVKRLMASSLEPLRAARSSRFLRMFDEAIISGRAALARR